MQGHSQSLPGCRVGQWRGRELMRSYGGGVGGGGGDGDTKVEIWVQLVTAVICTSRISLPGRLPDWQEEQGGSWGGVIVWL